jgi:hypothetical protein
MNAARKAGGNPSTAKYKAAVKVFKRAIRLTLLVPNCWNECLV